MKNMKLLNRRQLPLALTVALVIAGCGDSSQQKDQIAAQKAVEEFELLALVPANTPYVFAASRQFPRALSEKMLASFAQNMQGNNLRQNLQIIQAEGGDPEKRMARLIDAIVAEFDGKLTPAGLESLGLPLNGRSIAYGLGVLPVVWTEILDAAKVEALLERIEQRAGIQADKIVHGDWTYRRFDLGELVGIMEVRNDYLVMGLLPKASEKTLLPVLLGDEKPAESLASTGAFEKFIAQRKYLGYGDGYVDLVRLTRMALGDATGVNAQVLAALDVAPPEISPACSGFIKKMVQSVPRFSMGFTQVSEQGYAMQAIWETSPNVAKWLQKMSAPVPGLGIENDALVSFGLGVDLPAIRDGIKAFLNSVQTEGRDCEWVDQQALVQSMQSVDMMLNPMVSGIKGFNLMIDALTLNPATMKPDSLDARLVLESSDPRGMFGMLGMVSASFTQIDLADDGTPAQLPVNELSPTAPPTWVALKGNSLAFVSGASAPKGIDELLKLSVPEQPPLFALSYDAKALLDSVGPALETALQSMQGSQDVRDVSDAYASLKSNAALYGRIDMKMLGTQKGFVIEGRVNMN